MVAFWWMKPLTMINPRICLVRFAMIQLHMMISCKITACTLVSFKQTYKLNWPLIIVGSQVKKASRRVCQSGACVYWDVVCSWYHSSPYSTDFARHLNNGSHSLGIVDNTSWLVLNNLSLSTILDDSRYVRSDRHVPMTCDTQAFLGFFRLRWLVCL